MKWQRETLPSGLRAHLAPTHHPLRGPRGWAPTPGESRGPGGSGGSRFPGGLAHAACGQSRGDEAKFSTSRVSDHTGRAPPAEAPHDHTGHAPPAEAPQGVHLPVPHGLPPSHISSFKFSRTTATLRDGLICSFLCGVFSAHCVIGSCDPPPPSPHPETRCEVPQSHTQKMRGPLAGQVPEAMRS